MKTYLSNFYLSVLTGKTGKLRDLKARLASLNEESSKLKGLAEVSSSSAKKPAIIPKLSDKVKKTSVVQLYM